MPFLNLDALERRVANETFLIGGRDEQDMFDADEEMYKLHFAMKKKNRFVVGDIDFDPDVEDEFPRPSVEFVMECLNDMMEEEGNNGLTLPILFVVTTRRAPRNRVSRVAVGGYGAFSDQKQVRNYLRRIALQQDNAIQPQLIKHAGDLFIDDLKHKRYPPNVAWLVEDGVEVALVKFNKFMRQKFVRGKKSSLNKMIQRADTTDITKPEHISIFARYCTAVINEFNLINSDIIATLDATAGDVRLTRAQKRHFPFMSVHGMSKKEMLEAFETQANLIRELGNWYRDLILDKQVTLKPIRDQVDWARKMTPRTLFGYNLQFLKVLYDFKNMMDEAGLTCRQRCPSKPGIKKCEQLCREERLAAAEQQQEEEEEEPRRRRRNNSKKPKARRRR